MLLVFCIPVLLPAGTIGEVVSVSAMIHRISAGAATAIDVTVDKNGSTVLAADPTDISAFTEDAPGVIAIIANTVEAGDAFLITLGHTGAGEFEVSVTVDVKLQHVS